MVVGSQRHAPTVLPPGNTQFLLYRWLGWPQSRSGRVRKISPPPGLDHRTVQPVSSRYTDWANPAHFQDRDRLRYYVLPFSIIVTFCGYDVTGLVGRRDARRRCYILNNITNKYFIPFIHF
jgi:hypothetical protein